MFKPGKPIHPLSGSGIAPDAAATPEGVQISFDTGPNRNRQTTSAVIVTNREVLAGGNTLEISFADGADGKWFAIAPSTTISFPVSVHRCQLRGTSGGTAGYSIMGIIS